VSLSSVSIALDDWDVGLLGVARVAMADLNWSTAVVIIVWSAASSWLIAASLPILELLSELIVAML